MPVLIFFEWSALLVACTAFPIGIQLHSYNDLRQWPQLLVKIPLALNGGLFSVKVDFESLNEHGEFLLTHNSALEQVRYNTSAELLQQLAEMLETSSDLRIRTALCFKQSAEMTPDACDGSPGSRKWLEAVDTFFDAAQALVNQSDHRLEFVLDGYAQPEGCLRHRWEPWNATFIPGSEPSLALFTDQLQYSRYSVLNPSSASISQFRLLEIANFGKFQAGGYPLQLWETDEQERLLLFDHEFVDWRSDLDFAMHNVVNFDPAMWQVWTAEVTRTAWNHDVAVRGHAAQPVLLSIAPETWLVLYRADKATHYIGLTGSLIGGPPHVQFTGRTAVRLSSASVYNSDVWGLTENLVRYEVQRDKLEWKETIPLEEEIVNASKLRSSALGLVVGSADGDVVRLYVVSPTTGAVQGRLAVSWFPGNLEEFDFVDAGGRFLVVASNGSHAFVSFNSGDWSILGVGRSPSLSIGSGEDPVIALLMDGGYCFDSNSLHWSSEVKICDARPVACREVLTYTVGPLSDWEQVADQGVPVTPCGVLVHGSYDFGLRPSAVVTATDQGVVVMDVHQSVEGGRDLCGCGAPRSRVQGGLVLDAFVLGQRRARLPHVGLVGVSPVVHLVIVAVVAVLVLAIVLRTRCCCRKHADQ
mmetsp:Transcript_26360/g.56141  ORF Transcript_26360/g.56141 Transcript_26360/m.56141 type:complete len:642 (-) Transcript_26360:321-2246(-)